MNNNLTLVKDNFKELPNNIEAEQAVLGSILVLATTEEALSNGIILLIFYSLGLAIPFVVSGLLIQKFINVSKKLFTNKHIV